MNGHVFVFSREYPPNTVGGTSTVARNLAVGLAAHGWAVTVLTTGPGAGTDVRTHLDGVTVHRVGTAVTYNAESGLGDDAIRVHRRLYAAAEMLASQLGPPALVVLPDLFCYPEASMFARRHGVALVNLLLQEFRSIIPYDRDRHRVTTGVTAEREHLLALERRAVCDSAHTVFISRALSDAVAGHYPDSTAPHSVVHLGIDLAEIDTVAAGAAPAARRRDLLGDHGGQPLLVACGRLVPVKGFGPLLSAFARLGSGAHGDRPHLALIGVGPEEATLRANADRLGVAARVAFLGDISRAEALGWMSVADVAVVPSLWESFCYVCAEMMAFRRPVVASAVDSLRELIPDDTVGYPVPVSGPPGARVLDPADLAARLAEALADPAGAAVRGRAARQRIEQLFTNDRFADGMSNLARRLIGAGHG